MATIKMHHSLIRAHNILRALNASGKLPKKVAARFYAETWDNCREQGLCLQGGWFMPADDLKLPKVRLRYVTARIFFAEARGSDETVVVVDSKSEGIDNTPSEEAWKSDRHYFFNDSPKGNALAVAFIAKTMKDLLKGQVLV